MYNKIIQSNAKLKGINDELRGLSQKQKRIGVAISNGKILAKIDDFGNIEKNTNF